MKKQYGQIAVLILILALVLSACGTAEENKGVDTTVPKETIEETSILTEAIVETTEPEIEPDPEWLSETAIDEAYACLFPLAGERNVELAQEILLPLVEAGNAEAQYYWGYIYDLEVVDNRGEEEREGLYWYELAAEQGFTKAYLGVAVNDYFDSEEKRAELIDKAHQAGIFEMSAEELGADGCVLIACYYFFHEENYKKALEWFEKASEMGSTPAMLQIGVMYYNGIGVEKNILLSIEWLTKAANKGHIHAMQWLGYVLSKKETASLLINYDYSSSLEEYQKKADTGDADAMYHLGKMNEMGYGGISKNTTKALEWYQKSAEAGCADAMFKMGSVYEEGSIVEMNYELSQEWYQKAADAGHATAMYIIGKSHMDTNPETALIWYQKAANAGDTDAMEALSDIYFNGIVVPKDEILSSEWNSKAYEIRKKGDLLHYSDYGKIMYTGIEWEQKAADAGHADAMNDIGFYYDDGRGEYFESTKNGYFVFPDEAIIWYRKAANEGNSTAMTNLGNFYHMEDHYDLSMRWFIKAYVNGKDYVADDINNMLMKKQGVNAYFENYGELFSAKP